jgi:hypothetical protein
MVSAICSLPRRGGVKTSSSAATAGVGTSMVGSTSQASWRCASAATATATLFRPAQGATNRPVIVATE